MTFSDELLIKEIDNSCVILNLKNQTYFGLDQDSYEFYKILTKEPRVKNAIRQLLEIYDVSTERLEDDLLKLLNQLIEAEMIIITESE